MIKNNHAQIKEIFTSIQGEGLYVGCNQLFIRFCGCNLNCEYCDTEHENGQSYSTESFLKYVNKIKNIRSISLTGGEPLLHSDFLLEVLPKINHKIYLETNGTLFRELEKIIEFVDIIAMDIKLNSATAEGDLFLTHNKFVEIAKKHDKEIFLKMVFNEDITEDEVLKSVDLARKYDIELILQPEMKDKNLGILSSKMLEIFNKFNLLYEKIRLIPQVHKFLNID